MKKTQVSQREQVLAMGNVRQGLGQQFRFVDSFKKAVESQRKAILARRKDCQTK